MVAESSGIKDKAKLMKYLYENPDKLALKLQSLIKDKQGNSLPLVKIKGKGQGYYYSVNDKRLIRVCRDGEFYLLPWENLQDKDKCYIYTHHNWLVGCILSVFKDELQILGDN
tara:strand:+ start:233 stop:571 length:339 start_codon:yes stop_codon:yes gene_type:complete